MVLSVEVKLLVLCVGKCLWFCCLGFDIGEFVCDDYVVVFVEEDVVYEVVVVVFDFLFDYFDCFGYVFGMVVFCFDKFFCVY